MTILYITIVALLIVIVRDRRKLDDHQLAMNLLLAHLKGNTRVCYLSDDIFGIAKDKDIVIDDDDYIDA